MVEILSSNLLGLVDVSRGFPGATVIAVDGGGWLECDKVWIPSDGFGEGDRDGGVDGGARVTVVSASQFSVKSRLIRGAEQRARLGNEDNSSKLKTCRYNQS